MTERQSDLWTEQWNFWLKGVAADGVEKEKEEAETGLVEIH